METDSTLQDNIILKKKSSITTFILFKFIFRNFLFDKAVVILSSIIIFFAIIFAIIFIFYQDDNANIIIFYNFLFIFSFCALLFILIFRMVQLILVSKIEDKTIYLMISNHISRKKILSSLLLASMVYVFILQLLFLIFINTIPSLVALSFNLTLFRMSFVHFLYALIYSFTLFCFFILLSLSVKNQINTIICSIILTFNFIASLPNSFLQESEKNKVLNFSGGYVFSVPEVYKSFDLQEHILNSEIKFPHLSNYINTFFIENQLQSGSQFSNSNTVRLRKELWTQLGIMDNESIIFTIEDAVLSKFPSSWSSQEWRVGDQIHTNYVTLDPMFISKEELEQKIEVETDPNIKNVLIDLINFVTYIEAFFENSNVFQSNYANLFDDFINLKPGSVIINKRGSVSKDIDNELLKSIYLNYFGQNVNGVALRKNDEVEKLIEEKLFDPVMLSIRILENYFIKYTSIYTIATQNAIEVNSNWNDYYSARKSNSFFLWLNVLSNNLLNFTYYAKNSYDDIWFNYENISTINFDEQDNLFLPYKMYTFEISRSESNGLYYINLDSFNNFVPPYYYLLIQLIIAVFNFSLARISFNRKDLG